MGLTDFPNGITSFGIPVVGSGGPLTTSITGNVFFVDSGGAGNSGTFSNPDSTLDAAINRCTASNGDAIFVKPGHAETLTAAVALDVAGVSVIGLGVGDARPTFTINGTIDGINVTAADCAIRNIQFAASTAAATSHINAAAARLVVEGCRFECGATDGSSITITAAGDEVTFANNTWKVTADGPNYAIHIESHSVDQLKLLYNYFDGTSAANSWDDGVIFSSGPHTNCLVQGNNFAYMSGGIGGVEFTAAATGAIRDNFFAGGTLGAMLDPGSCLCMENYEADAIDQSARLFPTTVAS